MFEKVWCESFGEAVEVSERAGGAARKLGKDGFLSKDCPGGSNE